jgi:hypothetical protein
MGNRLFLKIPRPLAGEGNRRDARVRVQQRLASPVGSILANF